MKILDKVKPSKQEQEELELKVNSFIQKLKKKTNFIIIQGGSYAKNTWLKGDYDIDIFVKFPLDYKNKDISKILYSKIKSLKPVIIHGSRDYFQIKDKNITYEIIPVLNIKNSKQAVNIMDVSPLHTEWVKKNIKGLEDEVRIIKQFCIANNVYGAESYIRGFSGYVLEVLIAHYKSFKNLIRNAVKWNINHVIDINKFYIRKNIFANLNASKISPLIVIDPVQENRNAAAALSLEKFNRFKELCKKYMHNPSDKFFETKKFDVNKLKEYNIIELIPLKGNRDVIGTKILKIFEYIKMSLEREKIKIIDSFWYWNEKSYLCYKVKLDKYKTHYGPLLNQKEHLNKFRKKWKKYKLFKMKNKVYIKIKRSYNIKQYLNKLMKDKFIREKVSKISIKK